MTIYLTIAICIAIIALLFSVLGCYAYWFGMSWMGETLSHGALLGVSIAFIFNIPASLSLTILLIVVAFIIFSLIFLSHSTSNDVILLVVAHSLLATGYIISSMLPKMNFNLEQWLFGEILFLQINNIYQLVVLLLIFIIFLIIFHKNILLTAINENIAHVMSARPKIMQMSIILFIACAIALSIRLVGMLAIGTLLVTPAFSAHYYAKSVKAMITYAIIIGTFGALLGLIIAIYFNTQVSATITLSLITLCCFSLLYNRTKK